MNEFEIIKKIFAPLAEGAPGAFGLTDDAALVPVPDGCELVVTKDAIVAGVHFFPDDPADMVARKALRVNLSDLAAKGAQPVGYVMAIALPQSADQGWLERFAKGLRQDQAEYKISLYGGDTVSTSGPLTVSITAFGAVPRGRMVRRAGAKPGDLLYVTGTIGDAGLGLKVHSESQGNQETSDRSFLVQRYLLPQPRVELAETLPGIATASCDVSDGLVADAGHIAEVSGVGIEIDLERVPLSGAARAAGVDVTALVASGDDYEVLFSAAPSRERAIADCSSLIGLQMTEIGRIVSGAGVRILDGAGKELTLFKQGYAHKMGSP